MLYLEGLMAPTLAAQLGLRLLEPPLDWLPRLPEEYRRRWVRLMTLGDARRLPEIAFVKPPNDKAFAARPYRGDELPAEFDDDMPVLVAEVVTWEKEFRFFILDRRIRTFSIYLRNGQLQRDAGFECSTSEAADAAGLVERVVTDERVGLPRASVLDVGLIHGRSWAIVEQNAAWGSGIYGCDPAEVLEVLRHAVVRSTA